MEKSRLISVSPGDELIPYLTELRELEFPRLHFGDATR